MATKKRERLEIIKDILFCIREKKKIKPTRLLYSSNLSPQMFKEYINELVSKGFIKMVIDQSKNKEKEKKFFILTEKGNCFLNEYKIIENFIENFGL
jgi:predicted transcriptional regulator